jgi:hypothetical protein
MIWTKSAIRAARKVELPPLLAARGYGLGPLGNGNFRIMPDPHNPTAPTGLVVKQSFWVWSDRNISGNAIDFFTKVEGKSFHQAMQIITQATAYDSSEPVLREERGNNAKTAQ